MKGTMLALFAVASNNQMCYECSIGHVHNIVNQVNNIVDHIHNIGQSRAVCNGHGFYLQLPASMATTK